MPRTQSTDLVLARETQLMFSYIRDFEPISNDLNRWRGEIKTSTREGEDVTIPVEMLIPLKFPQYPPRIIVLDKNIHHPNIEPDGNVLLRITHDWKPDVHAYQVILALQELFSKVPPRVESKRRRARRGTVQARETVTTANQRKVEDIGTTITRLQAQIKEKDEELTKLRVELVKDSSEKVTKIEDIEMLLPKDKQQREELLLRSQNVALADLLSTLDAKFKDGEISPVDFAKLYRRYSKELYIVQKRLEKLE